MFIKKFDIEQLWSLLGLLSAVLELIHQYTIEFIYLILCISLILISSKWNNSDK